MDFSASTTYPISSFQNIQSNNIDNHPSFIDTNTITMNSSPFQSTIQPGDIYWLPRPQRLDAALLASLSIEEGCFGHPILILSTPDMGGNYNACIVSTICYILDPSHLPELSALSLRLAIPFSPYSISFI